MMAPMSPRLLVPLAFVAAVAAQDPSPPAPATTPQQLEQQLKEKLAQPFLARGSWCTDYDVARERAAAEHKLVFGYFTTAGY